MKLRDYQQDILTNIEAAEVFGDNKLIVDLATGCGKSLVISEICNLFSDRKILISTNITKLISQIASHLDAVGVDYSILKAGMEDKFDESKRVQLVMEQTLDARDNITLAADIVVRDEGHIGTSGKRYQKLIEASGCSLEIAFSATPFDSAGVALEGYEVIKGLNTKQATKLGYLTPANTYIAKFTKDIDLSEIGSSGDYSANELDGVINNDDYNQGVVDAYLSLPKQPRRSIAFVSSISHSDNLAAMFNKNGIKAKSVHSKNNEEACFEQPSDDGLLIETDIEQYEVIVSVNKIAVGFDDTSIDTCILCRPTKVRSLFVQMCGRSIRLHNGQDSVDILDCARLTLEHGFYDEVYDAPKDKKEAKKIQKSMKHEVIDYICDTNEADDVIRVTLKGVQDVKKALEDDLSPEALKARFAICMDVEELMDLLEMIAKVFSPHGFSKKFVSNKVVPFVKNEGGSLKAIKTRATNILKQGKKLNSLHYFVDFLKEQRW